MEGSCNCKSGSGCCWTGFVIKLLVVIGGLNWGLVAINPEWNVVHMALGQWAQVERAVYAVVGLAALWMLVKMFMKCCGGGCSCGTKK